MPMTEELARAALTTVQDPDLGRDLVSLGMVTAIDIDGDAVAVTINLTTPACPMKDRIEQDVVDAVRAAAVAQGDSACEVAVTFTAEPRRATAPGRALPDVQHVIAVGAGKGGVGKSTVSVALALGLSRAGAKVGLLDGDIYGPSMATMLGLDGIDPEARGNTLLPFDVHGIKAMTIAKLVDPDKPMVWRGPMAHKAFSQLLLQTDWGPLDYLIVDLPPGTGDVPLSLSQALPLSGAVIVCTPQRVAQDDARRAVHMFGQLGVPVLGVVENMSWFIADDGREYDLFGRGGAEEMATTMNLPFLGPLPLHIDMRKHGDDGTPLKNLEICDEVTNAIVGIAGACAQQVSIAAARGDTITPTISVS